MGSGIDPTVDFAFKRVFAADENVPLLIHFLNAVLEPEPSRRIVHIEHRTTINDRHTAADKLTIVDLRVRDSLGRRFIIEMQLALTQAFCERILYYGCRDFSQQLHKKDDFTALEPTIVICIVRGTLFADGDSHHTEFAMRSKDGRQVFSNHLEVHSIELGKFGADADALATALDQWLFFLKNGSELDSENLPQSLSAPEVQKAVEVLDMISQSEIDRERYELEYKRRKDLINRDKLLIAHAKQEWIDESRRLWQLIGIIRTLAGLLGESVPSDEELSQIPIQELSAREADLQRRLRERVSTPPGTAP